MVVAARALHPRAEEDVPGRVGQVVEDRLPLAAGVAVVVFVDPVAQVARRRERRGIAREQLVPGQLFLDEPVVGLVRVVSLDDVVAVAPGGRTEVVDAEAVAVRVAHEVEPGAGLPFAEGGGGEQAVDEFLVGQRVRVGDEGVDLGRRRRQARDIEGDAANQGRPLGGRRRGESRLAQACGDEAVDRVGGGAGRRLGPPDRLVGPPGSLLRADRAGEVLGVAFRRGAAGRPGRARPDPVRQHLDLRRGQAFALRRHHDLRVGGPDVPQEEAFLRVAGDERRAAVPAGGQAGEGIHDQTALVLPRRVAVALEATLLEQRDGLFRVGLVGAPQGQGGEAEQQGMMDAERHLMRNMNKPGPPAGKGKNRPPPDRSQRRRFQSG